LVNTQQRYSSADILSQPFGLKLFSAHWASKFVFVQVSTHTLITRNWLGSVGLTNELIHGAGSFEQYTVTQLVKKFPIIIETQSLSSSSQMPVVGPCLETYLSRNHVNIHLLFMLSSS